MTDISFGLVGISHKRAPVEIRELLGLDAARQARLYGLAGNGVLRGLAVLPTCNRVEFYGHCEGEKPATTVLRRLVSEVADLGEVEPYLYEYSGIAAARHLACVTSGIDSMVVGEAQIQGQVLDSLRRSQQEGAASQLLNVVFESAVRTGRRVRQETALGREPVSVASVAIDRLQNEVGSLENKHVAVIGLGEMGGLLAKILKRQDVGQLTFVNRTVEHAEALAAYSCARAVPLTVLCEAVSQADVVMSATDAPHLVIEPDDIAPRVGRPLFMVDLAVPRDIDPRVGTNPDIRLLDIDDLRAGIESSLIKRRSAIPDAEVIVDEEIGRLRSRVTELAVEPVIAELRRKAETIRKEELSRTLRDMEPMSKETAAKLDRFSQALVNKLLHDPTVQIRQQASRNGSVEEMTRMVQRLFDIGAPTPDR